MKRLCLILLLGLFTLTACVRPKPVAINYNEATGAYCGMFVSDPRYGSEIVTTTGKTYVFDSVECMVAFLLEGEEVPSDKLHSAWVSDFANPGTLINAEEAYYLKSGVLRSPMAVNITAFAKKQDLENAKAEYEGLELSYADLPNIVRESGLMQRVNDHMESLHGNPIDAAHRSESTTHGDD